MISHSNAGIRSNYHGPPHGWSGGVTVMLVTKTRVMLARWTQKLGAIVMSDTPQRWRRQSGDTQSHLVTFIRKLFIMSSWVWSAEYQLLSGRILAVLWASQAADCVKFLQIIMQDLLRVKVQEKFLVYNKIMAIKQVCIEISRFPDWRNGHGIANTWSRLFWFFIRLRTSEHDHCPYSYLALFQEKGFE